MAMATKSLISLIGSKSKSFFPLPRRNLSFVSPIRFQSTAKAHSNPDSHFTFTDKDLKSEESLKALFESWSSHHGFRFPTATDLDQRFNLFKNNARYVHEVNKQGRPYKLALNKFCAMTKEEVRNTCFGLGPKPKRR